MHKKIFNFLTSNCVLTLTVLLSHTTPVNAQTNELYTRLGLETSYRTGPNTGKEQLIQLRGMEFRNQQSLILPLFNKTLVLHRTQLKQRNDGFTWIGETTDGDLPSTTVLTVKNNHLSGVVFIKGGNYEITSNSQGQMLIRKPYHRIEQDYGCEEKVPQSEMDLNKNTVALRSSVPTFLSPIAEQRIMVIYTPEALAEVGTVAQMQAFIQNAIDVTNLAYSNSQVLINLVLAGSSQAGHSDTDDLGLDLSWMRNQLQTNGPMAQLRNSIQADVVSMIVGSGVDGCGKSFGMNRISMQSMDSLQFYANTLAANVVARICATTYLTFPHELGHNQGANHDPDHVDDPTLLTYPWSQGHQVPYQYSTIMAYDCPVGQHCARRPYFSNSNIIFGGVPAGLYNLHENYRTLNSTAYIVEGFRGPSRLIFKDGFEFGDTSGW